MTESGVHAFDTKAQAWERHQRFPTILVKVLEDRASHPGLSLMLVQVAVDGVIEMHQHEIETETAVALVGQGLLIWGEEKNQTPLAPGGGVTIRPRTPHSLRNVGDVPLELLAIHAPPVR